MINPAFTNGKEIRTGSFLRYRIYRPPAAPGTSGPALHRHNQGTDRPAKVRTTQSNYKAARCRRFGKITGPALHQARYRFAPGPPEPPAAGPGHPHTGRFRDCRAGSGHVPCRCARRRSDACRPSGPAMPACRRRHRRVRVWAVTRAAPPHPGYGTSVSATGRNGGRLGAGAPRGPAGRRAPSARPSPGIPVPVREHGVRSAAFRAGLATPLPPAPIRGHSR